jgi:hypothetical protein
MCQTDVQAKHIGYNHMHMQQMLQHKQAGMLNQQSPAESCLLEAVTDNITASITVPL